MNRQHYFQLVVWVIVAYFIATFTFEEDGAINALAAFVGGGIAAYYSLAIIQLLKMPFDWLLRSEPPKGGGKH